MIQLECHLIIEYHNQHARTIQTASHNIKRLQPESQNHSPQCSKYAQVSMIYCNWTEQKRQPPSGPGSGGLQPFSNMSMQKFTMDSQQPKRLDSVIGGDVWQLVNTMKLFHCDSVIANSESIATRLGNNN